MIFFGNRSPSYYELYLTDLLRGENDTRFNDKEFIENRSEKAAQTFENARLDGKTVSQAQELAIGALTEKLFDEITD